MSEKDVCCEAQALEAAAGPDSRHEHHASCPEHRPEHRHGHQHGPFPGHHHAHPHGHKRHCQQDHADAAAKILTIRSHSGIAGDMILAGLAALLQETAADADIALHLREIPGAIMPELADCFSLDQHKIAGICGWQAQVNLPHAHEHRDLAAIKKIIAAAKIAEAAKCRAGICFELLAACEAAAHGIDLEDVHFHEVGALDSILDICMACELFARLGEPQVICSPLPLADGQIACAHGILPAPAPAVLRLMQGIPVAPFAGEASAGELVTPTGIALLRAFDASFGAWPSFRIEAAVLAYGQREFANAANGVIFALGTGQAEFGS